MLLPEPLLDRSCFVDRPLWSVVEDGVMRSRLGDAPDLERLDRCSLVVARRRHGRWRGPIAGFRVATELRRAWLSELLDVDVCPWEDDDAAHVFDWGVAAVLEYVRLFGTERPGRRRRSPAIEGIIVPPGLGGAAVRRWIEEHATRE